MERAILLARIKSRLQLAFGERLAAAVLFGSEATNTAGPDSDIDIMVLLRGEPTMADDIKAVDVLYPLTLECGRPIYPICEDVVVYEAGEYPLYINAKAEGIVL